MIPYSCLMALLNEKVESSSRLCTPVVIGLHMDRVALVMWCLLYARHPPGLTCLSGTR
jgi:hypothetical protein